MDGVYTSDPKLDPTATRYDEVTFMDVVRKDLRGRRAPVEDQPVARGCDAGARSGRGRNFSAAMA